MILIMMMGRIMIMRWREDCENYAMMMEMIIMIVFASDHDEENDDGEDYNKDFSICANICTFCCWIFYDI